MISGFVHASDFLIIYNYSAVMAPKVNLKGKSELGEVKLEKLKVH